MRAKTARRPRPVTSAKGAAQSVKKSLGWIVSVEDPPAGAPPIVQRLACSFLYAMDQAVINVAYQQAKAVIATDPVKDEGHAASIWIQRMAERELRRTNPALLKDGSDYRRFGGDIQTAFQEPSFCLGFALAFLLFGEKGGAR